MYFGGDGPEIPVAFRDNAGFDICKVGVGYKHVEDSALVGSFVTWLRSLGQSGYVDPPWDWLSGR